MSTYVENMANMSLDLASARAEVRRLLGVSRGLDEWAKQLNADVVARTEALEVAILERSRLAVDNARLQAQIDNALRFCDAVDAIPRKPRALAMAAVRDFRRALLAKLALADG